MFLNCCRICSCLDSPDGNLTDSGHYKPKNKGKHEQKSNFDFVDDSFHVGMRKKKSSTASKKKPNQVVGIEEE